MKSKNLNLVGFVLIVLGTLNYGLYGVLTRLISPNFGPFSQNVTRSTIHLILLLLFLAFSKRKLTQVKKRI